MSFFITNRRDLHPSAGTTAFFFMQIPSKRECYRLLCEMETMEHIVAHSLQVCRVATFLVDNLTARNAKLNRDLVQASALLHDITKTRSFKTKESHDSTGAQLLAGLGYHDVGSIVGQHVRLNENFISNSLGEAEIVNYADKRVLHDKVVSLEERMNDILVRYVKTPEQQVRVRLFWKKLKQLEGRIFYYLPFSPGELGSFLEPEGHSADLPAADLLDYHRVCNEHSASPL